MFNNSEMVQKANRDMPLILLLWEIKVVPLVVCARVQEHIKYPQNWSFFNVAFKQSHDIKDMSYSLNNHITICSPLCEDAKYAIKVKEWQRMQ